MIAKINTARQKGHTVVGGLSSAGRPGICPNVSSVYRYYLFLSYYLRVCRDDTMQETGSRIMGEETR